MQNIIQIILSVALIVVIILQSKGTGLGSAWGGSGGSYHSKRGVEKILYYLTISLAILFVVSALLSAL